MVLDGVGGFDGGGVPSRLFFPGFQVGDQVLHLVAAVLRIPGREQCEKASPVGDFFHDVPVIGDDRQPGRERFDDGDAESVPHRGEHETVEVLQDGGDVSPASQEMDEGGETILLAVRDTGVVQTGLRVGLLSDEVELELSARLFQEFEGLAYDDLGAPIHEIADHAEADGLAAFLEEVRLGIGRIHLVEVDTVVYQMAAPFGAA